MSDRGRLTSRLGFALVLLAPRLAAADPSERFVDGQGRTRSFDHEYEAWIEWREPRYLRAAAGVAALTAAGTVIYVVQQFDRDDADDPGLFEKLTFEAVSFDDNSFGTNFVLHPLAGTLMYDWSRVNGLDFYTALGYTALASTVFEFFLEYRDKVSVNDLVFTPFGGMALGELWFHLGNYVNGARGRVAFGNRMAAYTLGFPQRVVASLDGTPLPDTGLPADSLGFSEAYWHRFDLGYGVGALVNDDSDWSVAHSFEVGAKLAAMPGFLRTGRFDKAFDQGNFTDGRLRVLVDHDGLAEIDAHAFALLFGYYAQDVRGRYGISQVIGGGTRVRYYDSWRLDRRDGYAFVHPLGPVLAFWVLSGDVRARGRAELSLDFGAIRPLAYPLYAAQFGTEGLKSVLTRQGYVFAGCVSGRLELAGSYLFLSTGGGLNLGYCRSIQDLDRRQSQVTRDEPSGDLIVEIGGHVAVQPRGPLELRFEFEDRIRQGAMGDVQTDEWDMRAAAVISYIY